MFANQGLHGAMQSIAMVPSELGVSALERRVSGGLGLLDAASRKVVVSRCVPFLFQALSRLLCHRSRGRAVVSRELREVGGRQTYPFL